MVSGNRRTVDEVCSIEENRNPYHQRTPSRGSDYELQTWRESPTETLHGKRSAAEHSSLTPSFPTVLFLPLPPKTQRIITHAVAC